MAFPITSLSRQALRNVSRTGRLPPGASIVSGPAAYRSAFPVRLSTSRRLFASSPEPPDYLSEGELHVFNKLRTELQPEKLEVQDISGGCGSMYGVDIVSAKFAGLTVIKQHKLVNEVLKDEIKGWHGVQLKTKAP